MASDTISVTLAPSRAASLRDAPSSSLSPPAAPIPKNILDFAGFEYGLAESPILFTGGLGGSGSLDGGCSIVAGKYRRYGRQLKHNSTGGGYSSNVSSIGAGGTDVSVLVFRVYFAISALPVGQNRLLGGFASSTLNSHEAFSIRVKPDGFVEAGYISGGAGIPSVAQGALSNVQTSLIQTCPVRWHRLDAQVNVSGTTWTMDWQINGLDQPQVVSTGHAAAFWSGIFVGQMNQSDSSTSGQMYSDDYAFSTGEYPLGPGKTTMIVPASNYTFTNPLTFRNEDGTAIDASSWTRIAEGSTSGSNLPMPPGGTAIASAGDGHGVEEFGPFNNNNALRFHFENFSLPANAAISCVTAMFSCYSSASTPTPFGRMQMATDAASFLTRDFIAGGGANTITNHRHNNSQAPGANDIGGRILSPSGHSYWTEAEINASYVKFTVRSNAADAGTIYYGFPWYGLEIHLTSNDEFDIVGCGGVVVPPLRTLLGVGL